MPPNNDVGSDSLAWKWSNNRDFSSTESYKHIFTQGMEVSTSWEIPWSIRAPQRVRVFFWILWHGNLLMNVERRRHMTNDVTCPLCANKLESAVHALRDCSLASSIWRNVIPNKVHNLFFSLSFHDWLTWNVQDKGHFRFVDMEWSTLFSILCWLIWKAKNEVIFSNSHRNSQAVIATGCAWAKSYHEFDHKI